MELREVKKCLSCNAAQRWNIERPHAMPEYDADFTAFARDGCADAFRRLVERHIDAVHSAAGRVMDGRADAAADVAQAVFIQLARKAAVLPADLVVGSWLHRQTVRLALNARRSDARRASRERTAHDILTMNSPDPEPLHADLQPFIDQAIHALPELDQRLLVMRYFDHCQQREIAQRLGVNTGAVQKRLARALERVRQHLARRGVAVPVVALAAWFSESSVEAAPPALGAAIAARALPHAAAGTGFLAKLITIMTQIKALSAGAALGLAVGGIWASWPGPAGTLPLPHSASAQAPPAKPVVDKSSAHGFDPSPVPAPAATPEGLVAQLLEILSQPDNILTQNRLDAWLAGISPAAWPAFAALAGERLFADECRRCMRPLARAWSRADPSSAVPGMAGQKKSPGGTTLAGTAFEQWHRTDPSAAQRWLVEHQDDAPLAECMPGFITSVAESLRTTSDDAVIAWAAQLGGDDLRKAALKPLIPHPIKNTTTGEWNRLCTALANQPDPGFATMALGEVFSHWMRMDGNNYPPKRMPASEADTWLGTLPPGPQAVLAADLLLKAAATSWDEAAPIHALAVLQSMQPDMMEEKARQLITEAKGLGAGARSWVLPLLTGPDRDALILQAARQTAATDSFEWNSRLPRQAAAIQWAAELADPATRDPLIYGLYRRWLQDNDEPFYQGKDYAQMWVDRSALPPEIKAITQLARADFVPKTTTPPAPAK